MMEKIGVKTTLREEVTAATEVLKVVVVMMEGVE